MALAATSIAGCASRWGSGRAIATANGSRITEGAWASRLVRTAGPQELVGMIDAVIIRQQAARAGMKASPDAIKAEIGDISSYLGSPDALKARLKQLKMTTADLDRRAEDQVLLSDLARRTIKVSDAEAKEYYKAHAAEFHHGPLAHARMMLFSQRSSADAVMTALKAGGSFAGLAKSLSEDPATAPEGGDMGWFQARDYAAKISEVAFGLPVGALSPVFQGPDGWYIIKVEGHRPAGSVALSKVRSQIVAQITQDRLMDARVAWLRAARKQAKIVIKDKRLAASVKLLLATAPPPPPLPGMITPEQMVSQASTPAPNVGPS